MIADSARALYQLTLAHPVASVLCAPFVAFVAYLIFNEYYRWSIRLPNFKGPKGYPLLGNIPHIKVNAAEQYKKWSEKYGPLYQIQLGNIPVVVVNSAEHASKVFISNSHATISRPMFYTFHKVVSSTAGFTIGTSPYSESLKRRRKAAASALNRPSVHSYVPHIDLETKEFIRDAFERGKKGTFGLDPLPLVQRLSLNLSLTLNWGTRLDSVDDELFAEITEVEEFVSRFRSTTGNMQDYVPLMRLNPFNGQSKLAAEMRARRDVYLRQMNKELDERIANKTHKPCIQANVILDPEAKLSAEELMSISLTMVSGGLDTITTLVQWALILLAKRPDIQERAYQAVLEHQGGEEPILGDPLDEKCTYIQALVRELLRLYTPLRLALPKCAENDFVVDGKKIPKGTPVFLNSWACNTDPKVFDKPLEFRPERFVEKMSTPIYTYGFGSRMCAGYMLGNRELYLLFYRLISAFEILPATDPSKLDENPITGCCDPTSLVSQPYPYEVYFKPRNAAKLEKALKEFQVCTV
uniref:ARAD1C22132p n=1 Tax=Blastobotrys adeninivorans TaxID=409370 RepID=A0A060T6Q7_BLAAD